MAKTFERKRNRLALDNYRGWKAYLLTSVTHGRNDAFADPSWTARCIADLRTAADEQGFAVLAYCFMPDHLHLLITGATGSFVPHFMKRFKQSTGFAYRKAHGRGLWQKSYHDHILREEEDTAAAADYIFGNPVRAGLAKSAGDYPFSGSFVLDRTGLWDG